MGDTFEAVIASVTNFGLFVRLNDLFIDGLVHISSLGSDYYQFDPMRQRLIGEHTGQIYQVGDPVTVKVAAVNLDDRQIDLVMLGDSGKGGRRKSAPSREKPMTARERVNREGAKMAKAAKSTGAKSKASSDKAGASKSKSKAGAKPKKSVKNSAKKPKAAKRSTRKK